jgi:hypothetical protein
MSELDDIVNRRAAENRARAERAAADKSRAERSDLDRLVAETLEMASAVALVMPAHVDDLEPVQVGSSTPIAGLQVYEYVRGTMYGESLPAYLYLLRDGRFVNDGRIWDFGLLSSSRGDAWAADHVARIHAGLAKIHERYTGRGVPAASAQARQRAARIRARWDADTQRGIAEARKAQRPGAGVWAWGIAAAVVVVFFIAIVITAAAGG